MTREIVLTLTPEELLHLYEYFIIREGFAPYPNNEKRKKYWKVHEELGDKLEKVIYDSEKHYPKTGK